LEIIFKGPYLRAANVLFNGVPANSEAEIIPENLIRIMPAKGESCRLFFYFMAAEFFFELRISA
jgi:hypothetical protein